MDVSATIRSEGGVPLLVTINGHPHRQVALDRYDEAENTSNEVTLTPSELRDIVRLAQMQGWSI